MIDAKRLLDQFVGSGVAGGLVGGLAGGALANMLSGKKARKFAGSALKVGGVALVGGLAYKAWQHYQQGAAGQGAGGAGASAATADRQAFIPAATDPGAHALSLLLVRSMITAAKADGQIDSAESQAILEQINGLDLPAEERAFLFEEYARPLDIAALVADVDSPEHAAEVYAASLLVVEPATPPEQVYLDNLARELRLDTALVAEIDNAVRSGQAAA
ncbi:MAG: tellurite resistance TerB family protein [Gammaproteobacteria bacterium]|nr:tellurite resistance TerB family protein [Gammaproteobacteria bacterium]